MPMVYTRDGVVVTVTNTGLVNPSKNWDKAFHFDNSVVVRPGDTVITENGMTAVKPQPRIRASNFWNLFTETELGEIMEAEETDTRISEFAVWLGNCGPKVLALNNSVIMEFLDVVLSGEFIDAERYSEIMNAVAVR